MVSAVTHREAKIVDCLKTPVKITDPNSGKVIETLGIWDTGATNSVITKSAATKLGLIPIQMANVRGVHGVKLVNVYRVSITLNNENITLTTLVTECDALNDVDDTGMLIGMNVVSMGDLCISNFEGKTFLTFRTPSLETVDYVAEIDEHNQIYKIHKAKSAHGDEKCPCGSGKLFKNCHARSKYFQG